MLSVLLLVAQWEALACWHWNCPLPLFLSIDANGCPFLFGNVIPGTFFFFLFEIYLYSHSYSLSLPAFSLLLPLSQPLYLLKSTLMGFYSIQIVMNSNGMVSNFTGSNEVSRETPDVTKHRLKSAVQN